MLKEDMGILKNRPYFGGAKNSRQIRAINEIKLHMNLIIFNSYAGTSALIHIVTHPFSLNDSWYVYFEEIGISCRANHAKRMKLADYSVIPNSNGIWETEWCLLKTKSMNPKIKISKYQPQYYNR